MKNIILLFSAMLTVSTAFAELKSDFAAMNKSTKGPFGPNTLQGSLGIQLVANGGKQPPPPGKFQFQAAYRTPLAQSMAKNYGLYLGNLFTTNYYELLGEFVFFNSFGVVDQIAHNALSQSNAMAKAVSMVRNWVLEKHYLNTLPDSKMARSFQLRGIAGAEFEQQYAIHFLNFYLNGLSNEFEFLPVYLLAKASPLGSSSSLDKARNLISVLYEYESAPYLGPFGNGSMPVYIKRLYQIRNIIHNQLTPGIIAQMNQFIKDFPAYGEDKRFTDIRTILIEYFNVDPKKLLASVKKSGSSELVQIVEKIAAGENTVQNLYLLSGKLAELRTSLTVNSTILLSKKTDTLVLILKISQYLSTELSRIPKINSREAVKAAVNVAYAEGFLISDNYRYFISVIDSATDLNVIIETLMDVIDIANDTLLLALTPSLDTWLAVEPKMKTFADNTIKSSSLSTVSSVATKLKGN